MTDEEYIRFMQSSLEGRIKAGMWNISRTEMLTGVLAPVVLVVLLAIGLLGWHFGFETH